MAKVVEEGGKKKIVTRKASEMLTGIYTIEDDDE